jgi:hypothetical protein
MTGEVGKRASAPGDLVLSLWFLIYGLYGILHYPGSSYHDLNLGNHGYSEVGKRVSALGNLVFLLWFLVSGLVIRVVDGDFVKLMVGRRTLGRWRLSDVVLCCVLGILYFNWLDVMLEILYLN